MRHALDCNGTAIYTNGIEAFLEHCQGDCRTGYGDFLASKTARPENHGFAVDVLHPRLFPFQDAIVRWALKRGRAAIFAGTGLGKTDMQVEWSKRVVEDTKGDVLILAPLAVAQQTVEEAMLLDQSVTLCRDYSDVRPGVNITNYDRIHKFDPERFAGVVLDESSILKSLDGKTRSTLIDAFGRTPYRLCCTATPAPNDTMELGNHSEFLGILPYVEMLATYFVHDGGETQKWRLKGHAEKIFWQWVASWAVVLQHPRDLGFDDDRYTLPALEMVEHVLPSDATEGALFAMPAQDLMQRRRARSSSVEQRCERVLEIVYNNDNGQSVFSRVLPQESDEKVSTVESLQRGSSGRETRVSEGLLSEESAQVGKANAGEASGAKCSPPREIRRGRSIPRRHEGESKSVAVRQPDESESAAAQEVQAQRRGVQGDAGSPELSVRDLRVQRHEQPKSVPGGRSLSSHRASSGLALRELQSRVGEVLRQSGVVGNGCRVSTPWIIWCDYNAEQDYLERALGDVAISIYGSLDIDEKEARLRAWLRGDRPVMLTKPSIAAFGINAQHCSNMVFAGISDSYEQLYQAIRRCWRFGQTRPVTAHLVLTEAERSVLDNLRRKEALAEQMQAAMVAEAMLAFRHENAPASIYTAPKVEVPSWLRPTV